MKKKKFLFFFLFIFFINGCVKRKLTVDSKPSGAHCEINGVYLGLTPVEYDYIESGDFRVFIRKDGYTFLNEHFKVRKKWFSYPALDLFGEAIPIRLKEDQRISFDLKPLMPISHEAFRLKAQEELKLIKGLKN